MNSVLWFVLVVAILGVNSAPTTTTSGSRSTSASGVTTSSTPRKTTQPESRKAVVTTKANTDKATSTEKSSTKKDDAEKPNGGNLNNLSQDKDKHLDNAAIVFAGICDPDGCVVEGDVFGDVLKSN